MTFFRTSPDRFESSADYLLGSYSSAGGSACCILGSGKSVSGKLGELSVQLRANRIVPFSINWGGYDKSGWGCYPSIWTSYDEVGKFSAQLFRDPSVVKFIPKGRQQEWIADGKYTAVECPNVYGFQNQVKGLSNFFGSGPIIDGKDSFVQSVDIAIRLGFKRIFLAGCDFFIDLNDAQLEWLNDQLSKFPDDKGVTEQFFLGDHRGSIWGAMSLIQKRSGVLTPELINQFGKLGDLQAYSFGNAGANWEKAVMMDHHCFASADLLVQSRRVLDTLGVSVILLDDFMSPIGRLRKFFPSLTLSDKMMDSSPDYQRQSLGVAVHVKPYSGVKKEEAKPSE